ncbi:MULTISPECIES: ABC transporter permease subunit [Alteromonadaceae]|uniref:ABC transporter permease subunit n=1 Tax=Brumicola blandensis TaxID=3075611 RepID=A0AAW8R120_9ALTE|nr:MULTISPECIES: ABC transporter permease subunit [unclassified Alteromonas]MDT0582887.1 ABC transporter permease subunit [Alteromonas sp. W409]MDT0628303.1 ABC transporter permease subunit [Alteromonas sp. W364]
MAQFNLYQEEYHPSPIMHIWLEFKRSHFALVGFAVLLLFCVITILAPLLAPYDPNVQNTNAILLPPAWEGNGTIAHLFGTNALGQDVFSRTLHACRITFGSSVILVFIALVVGVALGTLAGMNRGVKSSILNHLLDSLMAVPTLLIAIIIVAILGTGLANSMLAIILALIPQFVHQTRNFVREEMKKDYILLDRLDGASSFRIFWKSILPGMFELLAVQSTLALSVAIIDISALGFLNLGAQSPVVELGASLSQSLEVAYSAPWLIALPGFCIFLMVLSINIVGEGLRSALRNRLIH